MQTNLSAQYRDTPLGTDADRILRKCVHCGFCNATCPTYQLLNDEMDGPRGRIYLIKEMLEGTPPTRETQLHLDRCLTCLNCQTTCPSGVDYGELVGIGRTLIEQANTRSITDRLKRSLIRSIVAYPARFSPLIKLGQLFRFLVPPPFSNMIPRKQKLLPTSLAQHERKILLLEGCAQPALAPEINHAAIKVLDRLGIETLRETPAACCGALHHHTSAADESLDFMRRRIDAWWPQVTSGVEAIISTASGCGVHIKDYGHLLAHDPVYKDKAIKIAALTKDLSELIVAEDIDKLRTNKERRITVHPPCTLQHGQQLAGVVEQILDRIGYVQMPVEDRHICCGAAGSYSLLQVNLSDQLRENKIKALTAEQSDCIVSANIGCIHHLSAVSDRPVKHWIELLAESLD